jgi:hypothetical protein
MRMWFLGLATCLAMLTPVARAQEFAVAGMGGARTIPADAWQIVQLANQARAAAGAGSLRWDAALAEAARQHCLRMAAEGPISHRYGGELDVAGRAGQAGAHFSVIEENVAVGPSAGTIHEEWMHSPGHRQNLLSADVDSVGVALVASRGVLYAVADYSRAVPVLTAAQVEATVAGLVKTSGIAILHDPTAAREYCAQSKTPGGSHQPAFLMQWQDADLSQLPRALTERLASGRYAQAAVGSCAPQGVDGAFTVYRVAVVLY